MESTTWFHLILLSLAFLILIISWKLIFRSNGNSDQKTKKRKSALDLFQNCKHLGTDSVHFDAIVNEFVSLEEISRALKIAGLKKSQLVIGIDFTASNEWQGRKTFSQKSLHAVSEKVGDRRGRRGSHHQLAFFRDNPYQKVITILAQTLRPFDDDNLIPTFGFGDESTKDKSVFSLTGSMDVPCNGFQHVLLCYNEVVRRITMSGPTNFVPIITKALELVKKTKEYHILVIIADGQVADQHQKATRRAIINASCYPLSIIFVGVGDGPWDTMNKYDDRLKGRKFDNFQFVDFHAVTKKRWKSDVYFALHTLMEIPAQYRAIKALKLLENL